MRTRVKICGITRVEDALAAITAGADAIGLVFDRASPRCVTPDQACAIMQVLPPFVTTVGLFVDADPADARAVLGRVNIALLQFHGDETPEYCRQFGKPFMKAIRMRGDVDVRAQARRYIEAAALLLDAYVPGQPGGSGRTFNWDRIPRDLDRPIVLAGGLTPDNVRAAIAAVHPYAVDVSSGVELRPGVKDASKVRAFIEAVGATA